MEKLINGNSNSDTPAVKAKNTSTGAGIWSNSQTGASIIGQSIDGRGVLGESNNAQGVWGVSHSKNHGGVTGVNDNQSSEAGPGVLGVSDKYNGVIGITKADGHAGVAGVADEGNGNGVYGRSKNRNGVEGWSSAKEHSAIVGTNLGGGAGVLGNSSEGIGVRAISNNNEAINAATNSNVTAAIAAYQNNPGSTGAALFAKHAGGGMAAVFQGNVSVSGDIFLENADFAEDFDILDVTKCEVGSVMVLSQYGGLITSTNQYDKKVAGVLSGAGSYKPGIILDRNESDKTRMPLAMMGKVYCKVDANYAAIEVGDLLTTSNTEGHAMKAIDPQKAFGTVIGKALQGLDAGTGMIPILVSLQ